MTELLLTHDNILDLPFRNRHAGKVFRRQRLQVEATLACPDLHSPVLENKADFRAFRQGSQNLLQLSRSNGDRAIAIAAGIGSERGDLDLDVRRQKCQHPSPFFEQDV
ncbi:MAG: hypothetical protein AW12_02761 [Candidatus Accumulibacter sp. BA-94]|nr:MAG: hypothetical protein AW12_02761 [Candidatus Accumulibacter sp. BA-94]